MQRDYRKWQDQRRVENAMGSFIERWYGESCPPWTWPLTFFLVGSSVVFVAKVF